jgi:hypothetical protein
MSATFGCSSKGRATLIYRNFEYWKERDNSSGTITWRCKFHQRFQCKARVITAGDRVVSDRQPDHTHSGNLPIALARKAIGEMKDAMGETMSTPNSSQGAVAARLDNDVLMALPKRASLSRTLRLHRQTVTSAANGNLALPAIPTDLLFDIPDEFA